MHAHLHHPTAADARARTAPAYRARLAATADDLRAAQALRFEVFNLELDEGLVQSYDTGRDEDPFDAQCDHLLVEDAELGTVLGTYRLQTGRRAAAGLGYYSEREFDFAPLEAMRGQILELGRACIHREHRNFAVINLLWKGIAAYAQAHGARYLVGCSSLTSQDAREGAAAYRQLSRHLAPPAWRTRPTPAFDCTQDPGDTPPPRIPRLLSAYLALGAGICGPPALDREFRTIDFLTWLDVQTPSMLVTDQNRAVIAAQLGLKDLKVGNCYYNSAAEGVTPSLTNAWDDGYFGVGNLGSAGDAPYQKCVGRTYYNTSHLGLETADMFRDDDSRSDMLRFGCDIGQQVNFTNAFVLIDIKP